MPVKPPPVITVDFETYAIEGRPKYPPVPVGVSIQYPGRKPKYYAWDHPEGNNCSKQEATDALLECWRSNYGLLFHHAKFDVDVAESHLGLPRLSWERYHDTQYLLFLSDPHAKSFSLKPAAERLLAMPPEEQQAVRDWLVGAGIVTRKDTKWGAHIAKAPGKLVGEYAEGDTIRTLKLFQLLYGEVAERGMLPAYDTERELMPILLDNERQGIRVDLAGLEDDFVRYSNAKDKVDKWLLKALKADINLDSNEELADALDKAGIVTDWILTPTGKRSTAKDAMPPSIFKDKRVASALGYRSRLSTCMGTFMEPWLLVARETNGIIHTNWNQVRQYSTDSKSKGTRTGRLSSSPNFQNIPKDFYDKADEYEHPKHIKDILELPYMRKYLIPDKGGVWVKRDYNQQELRLLAHFEEGELCTAYNDNPLVDMHNFVKDRIAEIAHKEYERRKVKIVNFGIIYGQGAGSLAESMQCTVEESKDLKKAHRKALPGVRQLEQDLKYMGKSGQPIKTWGGREYYCEEPIMMGNRKITFEYKLLNYLIQGSAADVTKRSIINYNSIKKDGRFLATVHDENNLSVPKKAVKQEMKLLRQAMNDMKFDVPMLSDGETGGSWATLEKYSD